jgi:hypothetical protein
MLVWLWLTKRAPDVDVRRLLDATGTAVVRGERAVMRSRAARVGLVAALIVVAGYLLLTIRSRSKARAIPGAFPCRARLLGAERSGVVAEFPRRNLTGHWVHDVLVLHPSHALAAADDSYGVVELLDGPVAIERREFASFGDLVSMRYRLDSGDILELVCARQDEARAIGPFIGATSVRAV